MSRNRYVLCISDTHIPYEHPDTLKFLKAVMNEYPIDRVVHLGDEVDHAAINFHDKDPDALFTPGQELERSIEVSQSRSMKTTIFLPSINHRTMIRLHYIHFRE